LMDRVRSPERAATREPFLGLPDRIIDPDR
jgi:hypothetical protein